MDKESSEGEGELKTAKEGDFLDSEGKAGRSAKRGERGPGGQCRDQGVKREVSRDEKGYGCIGFSLRR